MAGPCGIFTRLPSSVPGGGHLRQCFRKSTYHSHQSTVKRQNDLTRDFCARRREREFAWPIKNTSRSRSSRCCGRLKSLLPFLFWWRGRQPNASFALQQCAVPLSRNLTTAAAVAGGICLACAGREWFFAVEARAILKVLTDGRQHAITSACFTRPARYRSGRRSICSWISQTTA